MLSTIDTLNRPEAVKEKIKSLWSAPVIIDNFLSEEEMNILKNSFAVSPRQDRHESPEGKKLSFTFITEDTAPRFFWEKLHVHLPKFTLKSGFAFDSNNPFLLHTDSGLFPTSIPYKNLTLCLEENIFGENLILYDVYNFFSTSVNTNESYVYSEEMLKNYNFLLGTPDEFLASKNTVAIPDVKEPLDGARKAKLLAHIPTSLHEKFKIAEVIEFKYNRLIIFDSCRLHSGSATTNVELRGKPKRMTLFTEYPDEQYGK